MKEKLLTLLYCLSFTFLMYKFLILFFRFAIDQGFFDLRVLLVCLIALYVQEFHTK